MSENFKSFVNSFSKFFQRNKKFQKKHFLSITIVVLFVVMSVSIPVYEAQAGIMSLTSGFLIDAIADLIKDGIDVLMNFIYAILFAVLNIGLMLSIVLVKFGAWCIDVALDPRLYMGDATAVPPVPGVLVSSTVDTGWKTVRDMCNTFYLFFLLIIAFGTILRSSTFNAKNLLPKLVLSLFLINFSAVIAKLVIDFGQVFMYEIMSWMGTFQGGGGSLTSIVDQFNAQINNAGLQASLDQVILVAFALTYSLVLGFVYIMLAIFLLIRLVAFVFLIILSPIAFLSIVLPSMSKYTSEWWSELVKYSLIGPIFMFFVYLSATMANELVSNFTPLATTNTGFDVVKDIAVLMIPHSIALFMLLAVIPITQRLGVAGSNKIIGGTAGIGKIAMGTYAGAKLAGGLGRKAGAGVVNRNKALSRSADSIRQKAYGAMGTFPGLKGAALRGKANVEKKRQEKLQKMEMSMGDLKNIDLTILESKANGIRGYGGTTEDKALLLKAAAAQGKLGDLRLNKDNTVYTDNDGNTEMKYSKYLEGAEPALGKKDMDEITDKNLSFATMTNEARERKDDSFSQDARDRMRAGGSRDDEIRREKVADLEKENKINQIQNLDNSEIAKAVYQGLSTEGKKKAVNSMPKDQQAKWAKGLGDVIEDNHGALNNDQKAENLKMITAKIKLDGELDATLNDSTGSYTMDNVGSIVKQLNTNQLSDLSDDSLDFVSETITISQIKNLLKSGENEMVDKIKDELEKKQTGGGGHRRSLDEADVEDKLKSINKEMN
ncbi:hypothetical protein KAS31_01470 [Candidatus Parcubacteria bacterium]|nr:hypothetical protein [Candidatus Parcubacteria bacterium]